MFSLKRIYYRFFQQVNRYVSSIYIHCLKQFADDISQIWFSNLHFSPSVSHYYSSVINLHEEMQRHCDRHPG